MFRLMKNEWKKIWIPVLLTLIVVTVAACTMTATIYPDYSLTYTLDAWEVGTEYLPKTRSHDFMRCCAGNDCI